MKLPSKLSGLTPYIPVDAGACVRLDANESFLAPPPELAEKIDKALRAVALNRYPDPLAAGVCRLAANLYGVEPENIVAGCGSDELIGLSLMAFLPHGGRVAIAEPDFSMYRFYASIYELQCVASERRDGAPDVEELIAAGRNADALILSNPCNPTGRGMTLSETRRLLSQTSCLVILDEAYMDFWDQSALGEINRFDHLMVLRTCSKAFGLAAARLGFAVAGSQLIDVLKSVKSPFNVSQLTQAVGEAVLSEPEYLRDCAERIKASTRGLRERAVALLEGRQGYQVFETVTNFVLIACPDAQALHRSLLSWGISVRLMGNTLRVTAGDERQNDAFCEAIKELAQ